MMMYKISHDATYSFSMVYAIVEVVGNESGVYYVSKEAYDECDYQELDMSNTICKIINNDTHREYNLILEMPNNELLVYCDDDDRAYVVDGIITENGWCRDYSDSNLDFIDEL